MSGGGGRVYLRGDFDGGKKELRWQEIARGGDAVEEKVRRRKERRTKEKSFSSRLCVQRSLVSVAHCCVPRTRWHPTVHRDAVELPRVHPRTPVLASSCPPTSARRPTVGYIYMENNKIKKIHVGCPPETKMQLEPVVGCCELRGRPGLSNCTAVMGLSGLLAFFFPTHTHPGERRGRPAGRPE
jgi:hypothetical protein